MEKKLYHVLTPVPPENLRLVNCLLLGNIAIPNCVLVSQVGVAWEEGGEKRVRLAGRFSIFLLWGLRVSRAVWALADGHICRKLPLMHKIN